MVTYPIDIACQWRFYITISKGDFGHDWIVSDAEHCLLLVGPKPCKSEARAFAKAMRALGKYFATCKLSQ